MTSLKEIIQSPIFAKQKKKLHKDAELIAGANTILKPFDPQITQH